LTEVVEKIATVNLTKSEFGHAIAGSAVLGIAVEAALGCALAFASLGAELLSDGAVELLGARATAARVVDPLLALGALGLAGALTLAVVLAAEGHPQVGAGALALVGAQLVGQGRGGGEAVVVDVNFESVAAALEILRFDSDVVDFGVGSSPNFEKLSVDSNETETCGGFGDKNGDIGAVSVKIELIDVDVTVLVDFELALGVDPRTAVSQRIAGHACLVSVTGAHIGLSLAAGRSLEG
jgi:hypothetical protein